MFKKWHFVLYDNKTTVKILCHFYMGKGELFTAELYSVFAGLYTPGHAANNSGTGTNKSITDLPFWWKLAQH